MPARVQVDFSSDSSEFRREADRASRELDQFAQRADRAGREVRQFGQRVDRAGRQARSNAREFRALGGALAGIVTGAVAVGTARTITLAAELGDELENMARATGLSADALQVYGVAFRQGGASQEQFIAGVSRLGLALSQARRGNAQLQADLAELNVTNLTDVDAALRQIIAHVNPQNFQALRPALRRVFGDDAIRFFATTLQASVNDIDTLRDRLGIIGAQSTKALSRLNAEIEILRTNIRAAFGQVVADNADAIASAVERTANFMRVIPPLIREIANDLPRLTPRTFLEALSVPDRVIRDIEDDFDRYLEAAEATVEKERRIAQRAQIAGLPALLRETGAEIDEARRRYGAYREDISRPAPPQFIPPGVPTPAELERAQLLNRTIIDSYRLRSLFREQQERDTEQTRIEAEAVNQLQLAFFALGRAGGEVTSEHERTMRTVMDTTDATNILSTTFAGAFSTAIAGAQSFGDALRSVGQQLLGIAAQAAILSGIGALFGQGGFGSLFAGFLGFGGGRQFGGPVRPGRAYVVGEERPELFIPDVPGRIEPDTSGQGGFTLTVNVGSGVDEFGVRRAIDESIPRIERALSRYSTQGGV